MSSDMTIETALADPLIRAVMRADRVEAQALDQLLRSVARRREALPVRAALPALAPRAPMTRWGFCCA